MSIPDNNDSGGAQPPNSFEWIERGGSSADSGAATDLHAHLSNSNTIIFDSFSSEVEVRKRNLVVNNISKINDPRRRFASEFNVRVTGKVTTILSASAVAEYRVVDDRRSGAQNMAKPIATFSSVISAASPVMARVVAMTTEPLAPVVSAESDNELIASLAAASVEQTMTIDDEVMTSLAALSAVATEKSNAVESTTPTTTTRTDQLRKRCHGLLQQREGATTHQRQNMVMDPHNVRIEPMHVNQQYPVAYSAIFPHNTSMTSTTPHLSEPGSFFVSVPRPREVHETLLQTTQVRRKRDSGELYHQSAGGIATTTVPATIFQRNSVFMDANGYALNGSGGGLAAPNLVRNLSYSFFDQTIITDSASSVSASIGDTAGSGNSSTTLDSANSAATPTHQSTLSSFHENLTPSPSGDRNSSVNTSSGSAMSSAFTPLSGYYRRLLPPIATPFVEDSAEYHPFQQPRVSSSEINFTSVLCSMPGDTLNFADIMFHRSSEEIVALCALAELGAKK